LIEHDMGVVMEISDHIVVLDYGVKISDGSAKAVRSDPKVIAAYLGVEDEAEIEVAAVRADLAKASPATSGAGKDKSRTKSAAKSPADKGKAAAQKPPARKPGPGKKAAAPTRKGRGRKS
jgi:branched-chain amino acid transport system ATP-binding protein